MGPVAESGTNPYLTGNFAPVEDELTVAPLEVTGTIPPGLTGTFLRNGPNPRFAPKGRYHLFDGDGMLHAVEFAAGGARYRNRWIASRGLAAEIKAGRSLYGGMANADFADPELVGDAGPMKNVANTHVVRHGGRILALWEAGPPTEVDATLATVGTYEFDGELLGAMTAHPKLDPVTGEMLFFGYSLFPPYLRAYTASRDGAITDRVDIDLPNPVMMHDFAITAEHMVFLDAPAHFDLDGFLAGGPMLRWDPGLGTRFGVLRRGGTAADVDWCEAQTCYVFHFLNAYSDDSAIHVYAARLPRMDIGLDGAAEDPLAPLGSALTRFDIEPSSGVVRETRLDDLAADFPRIDDRRAGLANRFGYLAGNLGARRDDAPFDCIVKYDLGRDGARTVWECGTEQPGEAVFAPDPDGTGEDDGWLLVHVHDPARGASDVAVLDATAVEAGPIARVHMPRRVPFGFHGNWLPA